MKIQKSKWYLVKRVQTGGYRVLPDRGPFRTEREAFAAMCESVPGDRTLLHRKPEFANTLALKGSYILTRKGITHD